MPNEPSPSLAGRATLAVALMIGFYVLALGLAGLLIWLPYYEWTVARTVHPKLVIIAVVGAGAILWAIFPRIDRFQPPGPTIDRRSQPELFAAIEEVARATQQEMPREVYLVNDANAWVTERGGLMGFGSRRVMGLGVPLMQLLTVSEFKGVVAHEFGHFHGGDTKLGPWIYKTRGAIVRSVQNLENSLLQKPFIWYGNMFLRMTHGISRGQEYAADALAAGVVGKHAMVSGLRAIHGAGPAYDVYWRSEAGPVLQAGFRPPISAGFARFLASPSTSDAVAKQLDEAAAKAKADPYDTHPALTERTSAIEALPSPARTIPKDDRSALTLLREIPAIEFRLLSSLAGEAEARKLQEIEWEQVAAVVYLPYWRTRCTQQADTLRGVRTADLPRLAAERGKAIDRALAAMNAGGGYEPALDAAMADVEAYGAAVAVALHDRGHSLECSPGNPIVYRNRDGGATPATIEPFDAVRALADGKMQPSEWSAACTAFGIADLALG